LLVNKGFVEVTGGKINGNAGCGLEVLGIYRLWVIVTRGATKSWLDCQLYLETR